VATHSAQYLDVYDATDDGLRWIHSASVIPKGTFSTTRFLDCCGECYAADSLVVGPPPSSGDDPHDYRGDTLRLSKTTNHIFVTTRGKDSSVRGYLVAFSLDPTTGHLSSPDSPPVAAYQTPTSGGKANAIEVTAVNGRGRNGELDWIALTDGEEGFVEVLSWDGEKFDEVDRVGLEQGDLASHAVWLE
jgi:carboxy-cis,cis-muconate cyclase